MRVTLDDLVRHHAAGPHQPAAEIAAEVARRGRVLVVLDDDPTGTQSVADLPVLTAWDVDSLAWALQQREPAVYVMTNSRSLAPADAARVNREVVTSALAAARETGVTVGFVSRSDSTLRGHFPLETDTIAETLAELDGPHVDGVVLVPAFGDAGRVTVDAVHHAGNPVDGYTPVGETEFARDATFGYASSDLRDWVAEKSGTTREQSRVVSLGLDLLRQDRAGTVALLRSLTHGQPVVADIVDENDLRLLSAALLEAEAAGSTFLYRVGPPFPRAFIGQEPRTPLTSAEVARIRDGGLAEDATGGLVVVGSHVALTTRQLDALRERTQPVELEIDVPTVRSEDRDAHLLAVVDTVVEALATGTVVVRTSRTLVRGDDADSSLDIARTVSTAVVEVVQQVLARRAPRFVVAKGGITSSDVASRGLGIARAYVRGPMLPGIVSLWEPVDGPARGIPYIVFAGNVGTDASLADVVDTLSR